MAFDKILLGTCGERRDGWLHIDSNSSRGADLVSSDGCLPALQTGEAQAVEVHGTLDDLSIERGRLALAEWRRWLGNGGTLVLETRDATQLLQVLAQDAPFDARRAALADRAEALLTGFSSGTLWTAARLRFELTSAGFADVRVAAAPGGHLRAEARQGASIIEPVAPVATHTSAAVVAARANAPRGASIETKAEVVVAPAFDSPGATTHVLAAPNLNDERALTAFLARFGPVFAGRSDIGLALLYDAAWMDAAEVSSNLARAHAAALGSGTALEIALVPMPLDQSGWRDLAPRVACRIDLDGDPLELTLSSIRPHTTPTEVAREIGGGLVPLEGVAFNTGLARRAAALHPWFYPVELSGHIVTPGIGSPCSPQYLVSRTTHRMQMLIDSVLSTVDVRGKRVLDLASNCGFWSSAWALAGASEVFGLEGRTEHVEQARLYWSSNDFLPASQWRFEQGDVANSADWRVIRDQPQFDVTLCAGILYHVQNYDEILRWAVSRTSGVLIVDTRVQDGPEIPIEEPGDLSFNAIESTRMKVVPNRQRLLSVLAELGLDCEVLDVPFGTAPGVDHDDDYAAGRRVTIVARKVRAAVPGGVRHGASLTNRGPQSSNESTTAGLRTHTLISA